MYKRKLSVSSWYRNKNKFKMMHGQPSIKTEVVVMERTTV